MACGELPGSDGPVAAAEAAAVARGHTYDDAGSRRASQRVSGVGRKTRHRMAEGEVHHPEFRSRGGRDPRFRE